MVYDSLGRNTQRTDTFGDVTKTDYDRAGNAVKQTDAKNKYTLISFDSRNRRKSTTDRISAGTTFTYLATGQLASLTDAESQTTAYTFDARGSKLTEQYPDHSSGSTVGQPGYGIVTFVMYKAGRVLRKQDQAGDTCSYNYDLAGRMTSRNYRTAANSPTGTIADTDTFTFDRGGRMLTAVSGRYNNTVGYAFDPVGRKASESLTIASQTYTVGSEFNARNELVKYTYPDSSIANRAYTARGALSELKLDSSVIDTRSYDDGGRMTTDVLGNGITETRAYRTDNLLSTISFSNTNIGNLTYSWDANKNKTAETIAGVMSGYGFTSAGTAYDDEDRLTGYQQASTNFNQSWSLTSVGDWSSVTTNGTAVTRTHGPTHELLTSGGQNVTTDVKGNQTVLPASLATQAAQLAFAWDYDNKLKSSDIDNNGSADVTFEYDALGRRVARTEGSTAVVYFQADQQTIADYPRGGSASTATYRYVFASYIDEPVVRKTTGTSGTVLYYHRNQQYSIYALTDSSGAVSERYAYTAYGQPTFLNASAAVQTSSAAGNRYTYTAREWDATLGLHHFRARWMSGLTGRFLSRDPIGYAGTWILYRGISPLRGIDPLGLFEDGVIPPIDSTGGCQWEKHHWFPQELKTQIYAKCPKNNFSIDTFTTPLMRCWGKYKDCDAHGWLHNSRNPKWNPSVQQTLNESATCCEFILKMAGEVSVAFAEIQDEFNPKNCCSKPKGKCYEGLGLIHYTGWHHSPDPFANGPINTLGVWAKMVEECRKGGSDPPDVSLPAGGASGLQPSVSPIDLMCGPAAIKIIRQGVCGAGGGGVAQEPRLLPFPQQPCTPSVPLRPTGTGGWFGW